MRIVKSFCPPRTSPQDTCKFDDMRLARVLVDIPRNQGALKVATRLTWSVPLNMLASLLSRFQCLLRPRLSASVHVLKPGTDVPDPSSHRPSFPDPHTRVQHDRVSSGRESFTPLCSFPKSRSWKPSSKHGSSSTVAVMRRN